ncbi:hypothetical protein BGK46_11835 [Salinivibrio sp. SS2]|nr:hypothetical protein BGK46_11835 [Salinivibrio sp. DV]
MHALTGWQMRAKPQFIMVSCQAEYDIDLCHARCVARRFTLPATMKRFYPCLRIGRGIKACLRAFDTGAIQPRGVKW